MHRKKYQTRRKKHQSKIPLEERFPKISPVNLDAFELRHQKSKVVEPYHNFLRTNVPFEDSYEKALQTDSTRELFRQNLFD